MKYCVYVIYGIIGFSILLCSGCTTRSISLLSGVVASKEKDFSIAVSSGALGWGFASHPFLAQFPDGEIHCYYYTVGDAHGLRAVPSELKKHSSPKISRDGGYSWQRGHDLYDPEETPWYPVYSSKRCSYNIDGMQSLWLFGWVGNSTKAVWHDYNAETQCVGKAHFPFSAQPSTRIAGTTEGLLLDCYVNSKSGSKLVLFNSKDGGENWALRSTIATPECAPWGNEGPNESALVQLSADELLCIIRVGSKMVRYNEPAVGVNLLEARSKDGGKTWSYKRMNISGVMPKLLMMSNGVLVLATGRIGNVLYFSTNGGRSWGSSLSLTPADVKTSGYCDIVEVEPGRLLAVYDMYNTDKNGIWLWEPKEVNGIYGCFVDVKKLW